jgi:hypothetical protein
VAGINLRAELLAYYQRFLTNGMLNIQVMQDFVTKLQIDWLYIPIYPTNITIIVAVSPVYTPVETVFVSIRCKRQSF